MNEFGGIAKVMAAREAVASVALSHPEGCTCTVCRAAGGDTDALAVVFAYAEHLMEGDN